MREEPLIPTSDFVGLGFHDPLKMPLRPDASRLLADRLAQRGVLVGGGEGRIRVSTRVYNDREDVGRFLEALDAVAGRASRVSA